MANPRAEFSAIVDRPRLSLPDGARIAVVLVVNVEEWSFDQPPIRPINPPPSGTSRVPDVQNFSWFEYGLRVGFWRMLRVMNRLEIKATMALNASLIESYPRVIEAGIQSGWEVLGHGYLQRPLPMETNEREVIRLSLNTIQAKTGKRPIGWMGPAMAETFETPDILAEENIQYVLDWMNDDQPYWMNVRQGSLLAIPYTVELNDVPIYVIQHHRSSELYDRVLDHLETLLHDEPETARVLPIGVHPYIMGQPHRFPYFAKMLERLRSTPGVRFMTGGEVLDWYKTSSR